MKDDLMAMAQVDPAVAKSFEAKKQGLSRAIYLEENTCLLAMLGFDTMTMSEKWNLPWKVKPQASLLMQLNDPPSA